MEDLQSLRQQEENAMSTMTRHPKYKKLVHLVHPSLYAFEKGATHVLPNVGADVVSSPAWDSFLGVQGIVNNDKPVKPDAEGLRNHPLYGNTYHQFDGVDPPSAAESSNFQWLPSEFFVSSSTTKPKCHINSYINNLHPIKYQGLYDKIGELFVETLPLMEEVLSEVNAKGKVRKQLPRFRSKIRERIRWRPWMSTPQPKEKNIVERPIPKFSKPKYTTKAKAVNLKDCPLQVIVKLISMELDPEEEEPEFGSMPYAQLEKHFSRECPDYFEGGHWHVEGTHDERIVASACCYLDSDNVVEEGLQFRDGSVGSSGCELGMVETFPGRILVWPNYLHHRTGSVGLEDMERPGHRTICCFHLVDPTLRIRSTATVPPQQQTWVYELVDVALTSLRPDSLICSEIHDFMVKDGSTVNYEEALERRRRLSQERAGDFKVIAGHLWIPSD
jgi:hypothetical protein